MQLGHVLRWILCKILLSLPSHGPVQLNKTDLSDGFYRLDMKINDVPKIGAVFHTKTGTKPIVALPLVLPMGWKNRPPVL